MEKVPDFLIRMNGVSLWHDHSTWLHSSIMSPKTLTLLTLQQAGVREAGEKWSQLKTWMGRREERAAPTHSYPSTATAATGNESDKDQVLKWLLNPDRPTAFSAVIITGRLILLVSNSCPLKMSKCSSLFLSARVRSRENCTVAGDLSASARICIKFAPV